MGTQMEGPPQVPGEGHTDSVLRLHFNEVPWWPSRILTGLALGLGAPVCAMGRGFSNVFPICISPSPHPKGIKQTNSSLLDSKHT